MKTKIINFYMTMFAVATLFAWGACNRDEPDPGGGGGGNVDDKTVELICSDIVEGLTLENSSAAVDYLIDCNATLDFDLEVESGAVIAFTQGSSLHVTTGSLKAIGSDGSRIHFRGENEETGEWGGITFSSNSSDNQLSYVTIRHTGDEDYSLHLEDGKVSINDLVIESSDGNGIRIGDDINVSDFANVTVKSHAGHPVYLNLAQLNVLNSDDNDFSGNDVDLIYLAGNRIESPSTFYRCNVPYNIDERMYIDANCKIAPGTQFNMNAGAGFYVYPDGSLDAQGEASNPIILKGAESEKGFWRGIGITSSSSKNNLKHLQISDAAGQSIIGAQNASIVVTGAVSLSDLQISNGEYYGIIIGRDATLNGFNSIVVNSHNIPMRTYLRHVNEMDTESCDMSGNVENYIELTNSTTESTVRMRKSSSPYLIDGKHYLKSSLSIDPGVELMFGPSAGIYVYPEGSLNAIGSNSDPIVMRGQDEGTKAYWRGLYIGSNSSKNEFENFTLSGAGISPMAGSVTAGIYIGHDAGCTVSNGSISNTAECGISYDFESNKVSISNIDYNNVDNETCDL